MIEFIAFYLLVGLLFNVGLGLFQFYAGASRGYIILPPAMLFFLTIFSWPKTLWDLISQFTSKDESDEG